MSKAAVALGAIFDWDGVVVNSTPLHVASWERLAAELGQRMPTDMRIGSTGIKTDELIARHLRWASDPAAVAALTVRKEELFRGLVREQGIEAEAGIVAFLRGLQALGVPCSVGSSAPRANVEVGLDALGVRDCFAAITSGDDVTHGKPAPDIFLQAAAKIQRAPAQCVVFEDAPAGIEAAHRAGMRVVAILNTHRAEQLPPADKVVGRLSEWTAEAFAAWAKRAASTPPPGIAAPGCPRC